MGPLLVGRREREASPLSSIHIGSLAGKAQSFDLLLTHWLFQKKKKGFAASVCSVGSLYGDGFGWLAFSECSSQPPSQGYCWVPCRWNSLNLLRRVCRKECLIITWWKVLLGGPFLRAEQNIWIPTWFFEGVNIIFNYLEILNSYKCPKSLSLADLSKGSDVLEQNQRDSPPVNKSSSLWKKEWPLLWSNSS